MLLSQAVKLLVLECQSRHLSPNTVRFYENCFNRCINITGDKLVKTITVHDLRGVLLSVPKQSARHYYVCIKRLFNFLLREEVIKRNPAEKLDCPKVQKKVVEALSTEEVLKLLKAAKENVHRGHNAIRDVVIITTLMATGLRCSELCDLKHEDVRINDGVMLLNGKGSKQRLVPIPTKLKGLLVRYSLERNKSRVYDASLPWFFRGRHGGRLDSHALTLMISKTAQRAGIKAHTHRLRHSFATHFMANDGADILTLQAICGWASLSMAQRYAHAGLPKMQRSMEAFSPINNI